MIFKSGSSGIGSGGGKSGSSVGGKSGNSKTHSSKQYLSCSRDTFHHKLLLVIILHKKHTFFIFRSFISNMSFSILLFDISVWL
jgi:hypothetical protein